jgi:hypothetical protein
MRKTLLFPILIISVAFGFWLTKPTEVLADTETLRPNSTYTESLIESTGSGGEPDNWSCVDEVTADGFGTYVYNTVTSYRSDLYNLPASSGSGTINSIAVYFVARSWDVSYLGYGRPVLRTHSTTYYGTAVSLPDGGGGSYGIFTTFSQPWSTNPYTGSAWTWDEIDALQIGVSLKTGLADAHVYCTQVYVVVDYTPAGANQPPSISSVTDSPDPVTAGNSITFTTYWSDPDSGDQTRLFICKNDSMGQALGGPACDGGSWCHNTSFDSTSPSSCSYTTDDGDVGSHNYYAFVCDDDDECSDSMSGSFTVEEAAVGEGVWQSCENGTLSGPNSWDYSMGYQFFANADGLVTKLCGYFSGTKRVRLYDYSYSVLASAQVESSANWSCVPIDPVEIVGGTLASTYYVVAEIASSGGYYRSGISLTGCTNGITIKKAVYQSPSGTFNSNHGESTSNMYGMADIVFSPGAAVTTPTVATDNATISSAQLQDDQAALKGNLTDIGGADSCDVWFQWGETTSYGNETTHVPKTSTGAFSATVNLSPGTVYHFRAVADNTAAGGGIDYGGDRRVAIYTVAGGQQQFITCQCETSDVGGCCDGCYFCPAGTVFDGSNCSDLSCTNYCDTAGNYCGGEMYLYQNRQACGAGGSCDGEVIGCYLQDCGETSSTCWSKCRKDYTHTCSDGSCGTYHTYVTASQGERCENGEFINTGFCAQSDYNARSADKCDKKRDLYRCNGSGYSDSDCSYDVGDEWAYVSANKIANSSGQEVDASSADNTSTCHDCAEGLCSGTYHWGECDGSGNPGPCSTYNQPETVYASAGHSLTSTCGTTGTTLCDEAWRDSPGEGDNNYGAGGNYSCQGSCDSSGNCDYAVNCSLIDAIPPITRIKIKRTSTGEDVTAAESWLKADTYTIEFEDSDEAEGSGLKSCEYYINSCEVGGANCDISVVSLTSRNCNWSFDITAGNDAPTYNLEGAGRYFIYSETTDNANNPGTDYKYLNFDFTPPETWIE